MPPTAQGEIELVYSLREDLNHARDEYGRAMNEAGRLEGELIMTKELAARVELLLASEAESRARADLLERENGNLRRWLAWRTISLEILLLGVAAISAVIWITRWWPWE